MNKLRLKSPAKLNLFLKVNKKRPDGYHDLTTLFERIDLCDDITLTLNKNGTIGISCSHPDVPSDSRNLVYKTAKILKDSLAVKSGVNIKIIKRVPVAAGLGGGSSNAATVLLGLNRLWRLKLSLKKMVEIAQKIGSDVPFFLYDASWAIGTERGDRIKKLSLPVKLWHVLVVAELKVYTSEIFGALNLKLTKPSTDVNILRCALKKNDLPRISHLLLNDLETAIVQSHPNLLKIKEELENLGAVGVSFSGSGPAVFGLVESRQKAENFKKILKKRYSRVFVVRTY